MTNHGETTGSHGSGPFGGETFGVGPSGTEPFGSGSLGSGDITYDGTGPNHQITLRTPAELADALPYLLGYRPEDSIVLVALHDRDGGGRFGGRARVGIPADHDDWPEAARQLARGLIRGSERRGVMPEQLVAFLCQEPANGETAREVARRLQPLAQTLREECGSLDVPVVEALCISDGRFWSYCCPTDRCCPDEGWPMGLPGTSVLAAAAAYAGLQVRGSLKELRARLLPWEASVARAQETALDAAGRALVPRILDEVSRAGVAEETLELAGRVLGRFADTPAVPGAVAADLRDDRLLDDGEAASLILGLQDRTTRDRAAEWMEGDEAAPALRLWRALARRCVGPYGEHAAAPLTLAGWVAWSSGDGLEAREALAMALGADPDYLFARLLHQACNEGLDPESVRRCLRAERTGRLHPAEQEAETGEDPPEAAAPRSSGEQNGPEAEAEAEAQGAKGPEDPEGVAPGTGAERHPAPGPRGRCAPAVAAAPSGRRRRVRGTAAVSGPGPARPPGRTRPRATGATGATDPARRARRRPTHEPQPDLSGDDA
ncbi:DUF4192 family protein [Streptomyces sp. NPDC003703]|uniref:DUF4192 domain-containing protein n=1 Tax=Streptomyces sp. NPDC003283 TaxID=3364681 RepID=UPI0036BF240A